MGKISFSDKGDFYSHLDMEDITDADYANTGSVCKAPRLTWQASFKKSKVKLDLLTDINILLMVEKGMRGVICNSIYRYAKVNNKYMKYYDKNKESLYIQYWDVNNLYGWVMSQKPPANNFEQIKDTCQFNEDFWCSISWQNT